MPTTELAQRLANRPVEQVDLRTQLMGMTEQFQLAMPRGFEAKQLVRDALTCLRETPKLAQCDPASVLGGLMTAAQLGLRPAVLGQCWLLPMWNRRAGGHQATLVVGYLGYLELINRSQRVAKITARKVYEFDKFDVEYGDSERLKHKPMLFGDRGDVVAYYATAQLVPKATTFQVMTKAEVEEHRDKFAMAKTKDGTVIGPWRDHFDQMALKTTILRLARLLPKTPELAAATVADGAVRQDHDPRADVITVTQDEPLEEPTPALSLEAAKAALGPVSDEVWARAEEQAKQAAAEAGYES
ncbi:MAG: recombinase RecT [Marmoricola sp.]